MALIAGHYKIGNEHNQHRAHRAVCVEVHAMNLKEFLPGGLRQKLRRAKRVTLSRLTRPNLYRLRTQHRVGVVFTAPSDMKIEERLYLYGFIRGFQPER